MLFNGFFFFLLLCLIILFSPQWWFLFSSPLPSPAPNQLPPALYLQPELRHHGRVDEGVGEKESEKGVRIDAESEGVL